MLDFLKRLIFLRALNWRILRIDIVFWWRFCYDRFHQRIYPLFLFGVHTWFYSPFIMHYRILFIFTQQRVALNVCFYNLRGWVYLRPLGVGSLLSRFRLTWFDVWFLLGNGSNLFDFLRAFHIWYDGLLIGFYLRQSWRDFNGILFDNCALVTLY